MSVSLYRSSALPFFSIISSCRISSSQSQFLSSRFLSLLPRLVACFRRLDSQRSHSILKSPFLLSCSTSFQPPALNVAALYLYQVDPLVLRRGFCNLQVLTSCSASSVSLDPLYKSNSLDSKDQIKRQLASRQQIPPSLPIASHCIRCIETQRR